MQVIADTGPLFDFLLLHFAKAFPEFEDAKTTLCYVRNNQETQAILTEYFDKRVQGLWTTSGVVAEVWRHSLVTPEKMQSRSGRKLKREAFVAEFWGTTLSWFRSKSVNEENVLLFDQPEDLVKTHGPVDIGLLELARRRRLPILTGDGPLKRRCLEEDVICRHVTELWE